MRTILIVDDDRAVVDLLSDALTESGFHVRVAFDGQMALEAVERLDTDLVLTDLRMPRMNGIDLVRRLRERPRPIPVLILTAADGAQPVSGVPLITKPFDIHEVIGAVERLLADSMRTV